VQLEGNRSAGEPIMLEFFEKLFATDFMPHGYCIRKPEIIWLHEISDLAIALAYFLIPIALVYLLRVRRDLVYPWMFWLFGLFILSCGSTHLLAAYVVWHPVYRLDGLVKALTAVSSLPTALLLIKLVPKVRLLPSPEQLRRKNAALASEITDRMRAEAEIRRLNAELEQSVAARTEELKRTNAELRKANDDLRQFAWAASHDLREPLRMVSIYSELAEREESERLSDRGRQYLGVAAKGARRMHLLLTDLMAYTEIASAPTTESEPEASAETALDEAISNLGPAINESGAAIRHTALPNVAAPRAVLVQVFHNVLSNAINYRKRRVAIEIDIDAELRGTDWVFSVKDNGIGIAPQYVEQIFGMFKRLHGSDVPGTGLGLALCRRILERSGGRIWVESEGEGKGSTFYFTVPASP
jgi:signal transduction histidine kinase